MCLDNKTKKQENFLKNFLVLTQNSSKLRFLGLKEDF